MLVVTYETYTYNTLGKRAPVKANIIYIITVYIFYYEWWFKNVKMNIQSHTAKVKSTEKNEWNAYLTTRVKITQNTKIILI